MSIRPREPSPSTLPIIIISGVLFVTLLTEVAAIKAWPVVAKAGVPAAGWAILAAILSIVLACIGSAVWVRRVDGHALLRAEERIQNKDAIVIGTVFVIVVLLGFILTAAVCAECLARQVVAEPNGQVGHAWRIYLPLMWAFAGTAVGGAFGFLFGLPKPRDTNGAAQDGQMPTHHIHTGLDDIVDWLTKGITTVALVKAEAVLRKFPVWAEELAKGLKVAPATAPETTAFAEALLIFFPAVGLIGTYLVTRTYLTGALTRADRSTLGAFSFAGLRYADVLALQRSLRAMNESDRTLSAEAQAAAKQLAALSLNDLQLPIEFALWAKAKSAAGDHDAALTGYEKAVTLCPRDPELLLDYSVALIDAGKRDEAAERIQEAYACLSTATSPDVRKNIYKSLTYMALYQPAPGGFEKASRLFKEFRDAVHEVTSGGLWVNEACAQGQRFLYLSAQQNVDRTAEKTQARTAALEAIRNAIRINPDWAALLRRQLEKDYKDAAGTPKDKGENDLEGFENDPEFRAALGIDLNPTADPNVEDHLADNA